ncbi:MAG TPA: AAA family ATPase [Candidatus Obscuribacterales bacterium]
MYSSSNTRTCTLLILVGPKGAGKTFIGTALESHLKIKFLNIESIFLDLLRQKPDLNGIAMEHQGFQLVLDQLDKLALIHPTLCIESTGTAQTFSDLMATIRQHFRVVLVRVYAPLETCLERVKARDAAIHLPVSEARLRQINAYAAAVTAPWDVELDNSAFLPETAIAQAIHPLVQA